MKYFNLTLISVITPILFMACVTVEMPDTMVSDSVKAGTDLYNTIKKKLQNEEQQMAEENIYAAAYLADENISLKTAKDKCVEKATNNAKSNLQKQQVNVKLVDEEVKTAGNEIVVACKIQVLD